MRNFLKHGALFAAAIAATGPAAAQGGNTEWWLVMDDNDAQAAHFVDMASIVRSQEATKVSAMTLSRSGHREIKTIAIDCDRMLGAPANPEVKAFVCGTEDYRQSNGLILGPVSPDEMAGMVFAMKSGDVAGVRDDQA